MNTEKRREALYEASMHVDHVLWLGGMHPNGVSGKLVELIEDTEPAELIELFGLGEDSSVLEFLEGDHELAAEFLVEEKSGFVVACETPVPQHISFNPEGEATSWCMGGVYWTFKAYGDTPEEAIEKALRIQQEWFEQEAQRQWEEKNAKE